MAIELADPLLASTQGKLLRRLQEKILDIDLPYLPAERVVIRKRGWLGKLDTPCCIVSIFGWEQTDSPLGKLRRRFDLMVTVAAASNLDLIEGYGTELVWEETLYKHLHEQDWAAEIGCEVPRVVNGVQHMRGAFDQMVDAQFLMVRCMTTESRA